ncbi:hypothetical protein MSSIT_2574 [Methanosarcina siciliae T4/M]|uniref:Uncharacterized protein n=1 Tax=Methanosarcina siciliae T4/M TaxID=1434120 RepID=A0A0E3P6B4_9EURY|nr:hypothetical protein MSSIT_2574 [Methanosarcina siciliae T4/M]
MKGRDSATPRTARIPLFSAIFAIGLAGSSPYTIPKGAENLPVPAPISRVLRFPGFSGKNVFRARSSDSYAGLYFSYQESYSSAYLSKASQGFIKVPPDENSPYDASLVCGFFLMKLLFSLFYFPFLFHFSVSLFCFTFLFHFSVSLAAHYPDYI